MTQMKNFNQVSRVDSEEDLEPSKQSTVTVSAPLPSFFRKVCLVSFILIIALIGIRAVNVPVNTHLKYTPVPVEGFHFHVFCPHKYRQEHDTYELRRRLLNAENKIDLYVVSIELVEFGNSSALSFCSETRKWNEPDCSNSRRVCTVPGPMFMLPRGSVIDVAWINNINNNKNIAIPYFSVFGEVCFNQPDIPHQYCKINAKYQSAQIYNNPKYDQCTYPDPTKLDIPQINQNGVNKTYITKTNIPIDIHIHGLQTRPTFDGNPLSWAAQDGSRGVGYMSLSNKEYYNTFNNYIPTDLTITEEQRYRVKINRYHNTQPAGNLWYHDHAMHNTNYNVRAGLAGNYIIYDNQIESKLPQGENLIYLVLAAGDEVGQNYTQFNNYSLPQKQAQYHHMRRGYKRNPRNIKIVSQGRSGQDSPDYDNSGIRLKRNSTYRFKILNAIYESQFTNLHFGGDCFIEGFQSKYCLNCCKQTFNYSIIGTDSAYFDKPIHNINNITISAGERVEFLIVFDDEKNPIPSHVKNLYLFSEDEDRSGGQYYQQFFVRMKFTLEDSVTTNQYSTPQQITSLANQIPILKDYKKCINQQLSIPGQCTKCVSVTRYRGLMYDNYINIINPKSPIQSLFFLNGHYKYSQAESQNPKIGTTQDWYFINTVLFPNLGGIDHPMHVHLINFQVVSKWQLKVFYSKINQPELQQIGNTVNCTYWELDFYQEVGFFDQPSVQEKLQNITKTIGGGELDAQCTYLRTIYRADSIEGNIMNQYYAQNQIDSEGVSGKTIFTKTSGKVEEQKYVDQIDGCTNTYKYICTDTPIPLPEWYQKWKEIALVPFGFAIQIRIRWTSTDYNSSKVVYPYFSRPEDELIEFPGFIYHCHFLNHEDNDMMRPIMMQASEEYKKKVLNQPSKYIKYYDCLKNYANNNNDLFDWSYRSICINKITNCT